MVPSLKLLNIDVRPHTVQKTARNVLFGLNIEKYQVFGVIGAIRGPIFKVKESKRQHHFFGPKVCEKKISWLKKVENLI